MSDIITSEFARTRPHQVADELEKFTIEDVTDFLRALDDSLSVHVMAKLSSRTLAMVLSRLEPVELAHYLFLASPRDAQSVISHIPGDQYEAMLEAATLAERPGVQSLLGVPAQTVAMQTTRRFVRVFKGQTCGAVIRELAESDLEDQSPIIATDEDSLYLGLIPLLEIIHRNNTDRNVEDFLLHVTPLKADASVNAVLSVIEWDDHPVLPVVDDDGLLVGTVALRDLRRYSGVLDEGAETRLAYSMMDAYLNFCADLIEMLFAGRRS